MEKHRLAACGVDCNECASYKVTMERDINAAELLVDWYRSMGWIGENEGAEAIMEKAPLCKGCWHTPNDDCFFKCGCGSRDFRICCTEKQINHCGECNEFPCEDYKEFASWHEGHQKAMDYLISLRNNTYSGGRA